MRGWTRILGATALGVAALLTYAESAHACGGIFCGGAPVDQNRERIVFAENEDGSWDMITQIRYSGPAEEFAWVLPVPEVPETRATFDALAMQTLDRLTAPQFRFPDCYWETFGFPELADDASGPPNADGGVDVHVSETVGPYEVVVVSSTNPAALADWLREHAFQVPEAMDPYIALYTAAGMKFLALRLSKDAEIGDIAPFRVSLPAGQPSVPLRLSALAADPEMGVAVTILAEQRYAPANAAPIEIADDALAWVATSDGFWSMRTNYESLVAQHVDAADGRGFVTEYATAAGPILETVRDSFAGSPEQEAARDALVEVMTGRAYLTRLYTRLAAEEMTYDPMFRRSGGGDVDRVREVSNLAGMGDLCEIDPPDFGDWDAFLQPARNEACADRTCGALGECLVVDDGDDVNLPACACAPGSAALRYTDVTGQDAIACQDRRMSFVNAGDRDDAGEMIPDMCAGVSCGLGTCEAFNMRPTCICDAGAVAIADGADGDGGVRCVRAPARDFPDRVMNLRPATRPDDQPTGRDVEIPPAPADGGLCAATPRPAPATAWLTLLVGLGGIVLARRRRA